LQGSSSEFIFICLNPPSSARWSNVGGVGEYQYVTKTLRMSRKVGELHTFFCVQCGEIAATIEPVDAAQPVNFGPGPTGEVLILSLNAPEPHFRFTWLGVLSGEATPDVARLLASTEIDPLVLAKYDRDLGAFCCHRCERNYCSTCWRTWPVFDTDGSGSFEETRGLCPAGHEQRLED
jgi:hypothetical protein